VIRGRSAAQTPEITRCVHQPRGGVLIPVRSKFNWRRGSGKSEDRRSRAITRASGDMFLRVEGNDISTQHTSGRQRPTSRSAFWSHPDTQDRIIKRVVVRGYPSPVTGTRGASPLLSPVVAPVLGWIGIPQPNQSTSHNEAPLIQDFTLLTAVLEFRESWLRWRASGSDGYPACTIAVAVPRPDAMDL
jgi:hypothetical protein